MSFLSCFAEALESPKYPKDPPQWQLQDSPYEALQPQWLCHTHPKLQSAWLLSPVVAGCLKWQRENRFWISKTSQQAHLLCGTCRRQYWELESLWSKDREPSYSQFPVLLLSCVSGTKMQGYTKKCLLPICAKRPRNIPGRVGRNLYVWTPSFGDSPSADNPPGSLDVLFQLTQFLTEQHQRQVKEPKAVKAHTAARRRSVVWVLLGGGGRIWGSRSEEGTGRDQGVMVYVFYSFCAVWLNIYTHSLQGQQKSHFPTEFGKIREGWNPNPLT